MKLESKFIIAGIGIVGALIIFVIAGSTYIQNSMVKNETFDTSSSQVTKTESSGSKVIEVSEQVNTPKSEVDKKDKEEPKVQTKMIAVHVAGAVKDGDKVVELAEGSRVEEAIALAGDITEEANLDTINLARVLVDGEKLYIPYKSDSKEKIQKITSISGKVNTGDGLINVNTAGKIELMSLKNVGESTAQKIIDYREKNGPFKKIEDLVNVSGIGEKTLNGFKDKIIVD